MVVALDAGTTGVRAVAVDPGGRIAHSSYRELTQHFPRPGRVEHDPAEIRRLAGEVLADVVARVDEPVAAIGVTNQRETVVAWDRRTGEPLAPAIVWQDRRTSARCTELAEAGYLDLVRRRTGLVLDPYFSATKLEWLFGPGGVEPTGHVAVGTVDSWLTWWLTGGAHVTDVSNASRTMLVDLATGDWDEELCGLFGVPRHVLAEIGPSSGRVGVTAAGLPVPAGITVGGLLGDQQAALLGQVCLEPGTAKATYGTGAFVLANAGTTCPEPADGLLVTAAWRFGGGPLVYALEGSVFAAGAAVQWLRDGLGIIDQAADVDALAASCGDSGGAMVVPAFTGLGSPWWDPDARGTIVGLTRGSGRPQLARAVLESIAWQVADGTDAMTAVIGPLQDLRVDGGAAASDLVCALQADASGLVVTRAAVRETTALGAAYAAGLAVGVWGPGDLASCWHGDRTDRPGVDRAAAAARREQWHRAVRRARGWARTQASN